MELKDIKYPIRVGRKQKRAVLDFKGREIVIFPAGQELFAEIFCAFLNYKVKLYEFKSLPDKDHKAITELALEAIHTEYGSYLDKMQAFGSEREAAGGYLLGFIEGFKQGQEI